MRVAVGVPREIKPGENRVALSPAGAAALAAAGAAVLVQRGAGEESGFPDAEYEAAGARLVPSAAQAWDADLVVKVKEPVAEEFPFLREESAVFAYLHLAAFAALAEALLASRVTALAYETVADGGALPLLRPMSEVAGVLAVQVGARGLEMACGGRGVLLAGVRGVPASRVVVIGAGTAGTNAARTAAGIGAEVTVLDISEDKLARAAAEAPGRIRTLRSSPAALSAALPEADLVVSTVLVVGDRAPVLVTRNMLKTMKKGAVVVDISIDQGGSLETSRATTHAAPYFVEEGVVHYCVSNMPAAVPRTSTLALTQATLPYILRLCAGGVAAALRGDPSLRAGLNTFRGKVTCEGVARALGRDYTPPESLL